MKLEDMIRMRDRLNRDIEKASKKTINITKDNYDYHKTSLAVRKLIEHLASESPTIHTVVTTGDTYTCTPRIAKEILGVV